jgi:hypothetical protein
MNIPSLLLLLREGLPHTSLNKVDTGVCEGERERAGRERGREKEKERKRWEGERG